MNSNPASTSTPNGCAPAAEPAATRSPTFSPLYLQIKALITQGLESGEWKPGEIIPSEVELAARYKGEPGDRPQDDRRTRRRQTPPTSSG